MVDALAESLARAMSDEAALLDEWLARQVASGAARPDLISDAELRRDSAEFLSLFRAASETGIDADLRDAHWRPVRDFLGTLSRGRATLGFTPVQTATFVFSLKEPLFTRIQQDLASDPQRLGEELWAITKTLDTLGLYTTEVYQRSREDVIHRQQQELLELSTPVIKLWQGVVAVPLIGTLDSSRTQVVMEALLQRIVETNSSIAIIDITGVPTVDTLVAQHLLKTIEAARLMGADCIISGIRPQIAQTIVQLGVDLGDVSTKSTMADAVAQAMRLLGFAITRPGNGPSNGG